MNRQFWESCFYKDRHAACCVNIETDCYLIQNTVNGIVFTDRFDANYFAISNRSELVNADFRKGIANPYLVYKTFS